MKKILVFIFTLLITNAFAQSSDFNDLLKAYVDKDGNVNYKSLKENENKLGSYLASLERTSPKESWSDNKKKAFWINVWRSK